MPPTSLRFEALGTHWRIDSEAPLGMEASQAIRGLLDEYDRTWSRFREDSLVTRIGRQGGRYRLPAEARPLLELYRSLCELTDGAVSPLVARALEARGYDRAYSLRPSGPPTPAPAWQDALSWDGETLQVPRPVLLDVGAAGKGQAVDLVCTLLDDLGVAEYCVDASGDLRHRGERGLRVALENPLDPRKAVGVVTLTGRALCASATNRRTWGDGLHHVIDATTGVPTRAVLATWVIADSAMLADGLTTALFFAEAERFAERFDFEYVRLTGDGRLERSPGFQGELFA